MPIFLKSTLPYFKPNISLRLAPVIKRECPSKDLKEVKERKRYRSAKMKRSIEFFLGSKRIKGINKNVKNRLEMGVSDRVSN